MQLKKLYLLIIITMLCAQNIFSQETSDIVIGEKFGEFYLIKEGLKKGDKIILEGIQKARSDMEIIPELTEFISHQIPQV